MRADPQKLGIDGPTDQHDRPEADQAEDQYGPHKPCGGRSQASLTRCRSGPDLSELEQFEAERLDLGKDAEQRGPILEHAGEHGLIAFQLRDHQGKGGKGGSSESAPYPDRVQARRCGHPVMLQPDLVSRRHQNLVIVRTPVFDDVQERVVERSRSSRAR